ncbi:SlyX family protein, partial [Vibrio owensii]
MTEKIIQQLEARINDLECQLAFQEQTIEDLYGALSEQKVEITKMLDQMKFVVG